MIIARLEEEASTSKREQERKHQLLLMDVQRTSKELETKYNESCNMVASLEGKISVLVEQIKQKVIGDRVLLLLLLLCYLFALSWMGVRSIISCFL